MDELHKAKTNRPLGGYDYTTFPRIGVGHFVDDKLVTVGFASKIDDQN